MAIVSIYNYYIFLCTIDFIYVDSLNTILKGKATKRWIIPRINFKVYMYDPNASENIMGSLNGPYLFDIIVEVVQKFVSYIKNLTK